VHNRRFVFGQLEALVSGARRHRRPLAVAMVDIDAFKAVNDRHGHEVGDRVLVAIGEALQRALRAEDVLGRLGGEEFVALRPTRARRRPRARRSGCAPRSPARTGRRASRRASAGRCCATQRRPTTSSGGPTRRSTPPSRRAGTGSGALLPCLVAHDDDR
jgi:GGDEF domain-containing protein